MIHVVEAACQFTQDRSRGTVVLESDVTGPDFSEAFRELGSTDARGVAQTYASAQGCAPAYINGNVIGPYPINAKGFPLDQVTGPGGQPLPVSHPDLQPARYRLEVPVSRPLR